MISALEQIVMQAWERVAQQIQTFLPGLLAGLLIVVAAYLVAGAARWLLSRIFTGVSWDRFLRQSGLASMFDPSGRMRAARVVAQTVFWAILGLGVLTGLSAFHTELTTRMIESVLVLLPRLLAAALIVIAAAWLAQFLSRTALVWAVNEAIPAPRRIAVAVRIFVIFVGVVAAADYLDFARRVFLAAFIIVVGGIVLAAGLSLGLAGRDAVRTYLQRPPQGEREPGEHSVWRHL